MYPQLHFEGRIDRYRLSRDLAHPPTSAHDSESGGSPTDSTRTNNMPHVSASLVHYFATQLGIDNQTSTTVRQTIARWMAINTQASFRESIKNSVVYWCALSTMMQVEDKLRAGAPGTIIDIDDLLVRFSKVITTQIGQLHKARAEITGGVPPTDIRADPMEQSRLEPGDLDRLEWYRMITSLDSMLANAQQVSQTRTQNR